MNECVQGQVRYGLRCHLDCLRRRRPLCGMPTHPRSVTGAPVEPYWMKFFGFALSGPFVPAAFLPKSQRLRLSVSAYGGFISASTV